MTLLSRFVNTKCIILHIFHFLTKVFTHFGLIYGQIYRQNLLARRDDLFMSRRGECIYKRKDGRWEARYVKESGVDGRKKYASIYASTYKEAKEKQLKAMHNIAKKITKSANLCIKDLAEEWLLCVKNRIKPSSYIKYENLCKNHIIKNLGNISIDKMSTVTIQQFATELKEKGRINGGQLSEKTVNDTLIILGKIFEYASEEYSIVPPVIKNIRQERKTARVFSPKEQQRLCLYCLNDINSYKFSILLALYTGMRIGELCALKWQDITDDSIIVYKTMQRLKTDNGDTEVFISDPKSESSKRVIPLPEFLKEFANKMRKADGYVLETNRSPFCEPRTMQHRFKETAKDLGFKGATFHTLRHTFATRCVEAGFDIKSLSEILGHSDVKVTLNRYVHSSFEQKQKNMQKLSLMSMA
ncbi:MAG: site-specific integrase [Ruminococcaceae bacterium]|nr:site-specific integrase [Oscillospiraceae bacterium]